MPWTSPKRYYLTDDRSTVVEEGDPRAAFLLVPKGGELTTEEAKKYGLLDPPERVQDEPEAKAISVTPENKAVTKPPEKK